MKILKALIYTDKPDGTIWSCDTIEYKGTMWLVPQWVDFINEGIKKPIRLVRLDRFQHQAIKFGENDFVLNEAVPSAFFETLPPKQIPARFVVLESPDISMPMSSKDSNS